MHVKMRGTRGSVPVAGLDHIYFGGNTTCIQIESECIPADSWLLVDTGTGAIPLSREALAAGIKHLRVLCTHSHHDHTQGLLLMPQLYIPGIKYYFYGPEENGVGPAEVIRDLMTPPKHPVDFAEVSNDLSFKTIEHPSKMVMVIHPEGGYRLMVVDEFLKVEASVGSDEPAQVRMGKNGKYALRECLVVRMYRSNHPERTICYRFEERPTGKVFVFLTDHENTDGISAKMREHLSGADLLVMDAQYSREVYDKRTAGFGHGTPDYCVRVAHAVGAKRLGLTHHDPMATDNDIWAIEDEAYKHAEAIGYVGEIAALRDYVSADFQQLYRALQALAQLALELGYKASMFGETGLFQLTIRQGDDFVPRKTAIDV